MTGGIDAWSSEVAEFIPRYEIVPISYFGEVTHKTLCSVFSQEAGLSQHELQKDCVSEPPYMNDAQNDPWQFIEQQCLYSCIATLISTKKNEPEWSAGAAVQSEPALVEHGGAQQKGYVIHLPADWEDVIYSSTLKSTAPRKKSFDEVDQDVLAMLNKQGRSLAEQERLANVAVDAIVHSVSIGATFKDKLAAVGVIFFSVLAAVQSFPMMVRKYLGAVVPYRDNKHAPLKSALFTDSSFRYIAKDLRSPMELSTSFSINATDTGQFHRLLKVLQSAKETAEGILTKSWTMVFLGKAWEEFIQALANLRAIDCDIRTIGQYLRQSIQHFPLVSYFARDEFAEFQRIGEELASVMLSPARLARISTSPSGRYRLARQINHETMSQRLGHAKH